MSNLKEIFSLFFFQLKHNYTEKLHHESMTTLASCSEYYDLMVIILATQGRACMED